MLISDSVSRPQIHLQIHHRMNLYMTFRRQKVENQRFGVTVSRRAARGEARGGKTEVTELGPKWLKVVSMCSLSITEAPPTLGCAKEAAKECINTSSKSDP